MSLSTILIILLVIVLFIITGIANYFTSAHYYLKKIEEAKQKEKEEQDKNKLKPLNS